MARIQRRRGLGSVWKVGERYAARYIHKGGAHSPGRTFTTPELADQWLADEQRLIDRGTWTSPNERRAAEQSQQAAAIASAEPLDTYAHAWIAGRTTAKGTPLAARTVQEYHRYLQGILAPLAARPLDQITRDDVEAWWRDNEGVPRYRHHAYSFLKSVLADAVKRERIPSNPCRVENAASVAPATPKAVRAGLVTELEPAEVQAMADAMPPRHRFLLLLLAWTGMRPGEAFALRRSDLDQRTDPAGVPRVRVNVFRAVTKGPEGGPPLVAGPPKTPGSVRSVLLPPHLHPDLSAHLDAYAARGADGLLFPSSNPGLDFCTVQQVAGTSAKRRKDRKGQTFRPATGWNAARLAVARPSLRLYDLRHWARRQWTRAGLDTATAEMLLGHELPRVLGTYAHLDLEHVWPVMVRCSELTGWTRPTIATPTRSAAGSGGISPRLLAAMTGDQLTHALAAMSDEQLAAVVPQLDPATLARVLSVTYGNEKITPHGQAGTWQ